MIIALSGSVYGADRVDMIVLLDNSVSVLPYYDQIQESLLKRVISEHLVPGDTFSLITFADYPEVEISREIKNKADIAEILSYSSILQPMGNYTDLVLALRFLYKYTLDLPLSNKKKIIILTDGIHDPPPGSAYFSSDKTYIQRELQKAGDDIHREGWDVSIVELDTGSSSTGAAAGSSTGSITGNSSTAYNRSSSDGTTVAGTNTSGTSTAGTALSGTTGSGTAGTKGSAPSSAGSSGAAASSASTGSASSGEAGIAASGGSAAASGGSENVSGGSDKAVNNNAAGTYDSGSADSNTGNAGSGTEPGGTQAENGFMDTVAESIGSKPNVFSSDEKDMAGIALGIPEVRVPEHIGVTDGTIKLPLEISNRSNEPILFSLSAVISGDSDLLKEKKALKLEPKASGKLNIELVLPEGLSYGEHSIDISLKLVGGINTSPRVIKLNFDYRQKGSLGRSLDFLTGWWVIAVIAAVLIAVLIIILIKRAPVTARSLSEVHEYQRNEAVAAAVTKEVNEEQNEASVRNGKTRAPEEYLIAAMATEIEDSSAFEKKNRPIQMHVYGQNSKLGISNVKWLGLNRKRSVGSSGTAVFRIFFLKVPGVIAYIECAGDDFIFTPVETEYFPDLEGPLHECLYRRIRIINRDGHVFHIEFRQWVSELEKVNKLLSMTKYSGTPERGY